MHNNPNQNMQQNIPIINNNNNTNNNQSVINITKPQNDPAETKRKLKSNSILVIYSLGI